MKKPANCGCCNLLEQNAQQDMMKKYILLSMLSLLLCPLWGQRGIGMTKANWTERSPEEIADQMLNSIIGHPEAGRDHLRTPSGSPQDGSGGQALIPTPGFEGTSIIWENPGWELDYDWDTTNTTWKLTKGKTYTYNALGQLTEAQTDNNVANVLQPSMKYRYNYNGQWHIVRRLAYQWDSGSWQLAYRAIWNVDSHGNITSLTGDQFSVTWHTVYADSTSYTYTLGDKIASKLFQRKNLNTGQYENAIRETYAYSPDSLVVEYVYGWWSGSQWDNRREEYLYDNNGVLLKTTEYLGQDSVWQKHKEYRWISWHDQSRMLPLFYEEDQFIPDSILPINQTRHRLIYGPNDSRVNYDERFIQQQWDSTSYWTLDRDPQQHVTQFEYYYKTPDWEFIAGQRSHFTYDSNLKVTEERHEIRPFQHPSYVGTYRKTYGNFLLLSESAPFTVSPQAKVYPNPCSDRLKIEWDATTLPLEICLYDLQGRLRAASICPNAANGVVEVPISETLENGCYLFRVRSAENESTGKIIVQH
jgi:hypothetical protein